MMNFLRFLLASFSFASLAHADDALDRLKQGVPASVAEFIDRSANCNHWAGEPPYDAERAKEIDRALLELRCSNLDADQARLLKRYKGNTTVEHAIRQGRQLSL